MKKYKLKLLQIIKYCLKFLSDENYMKLYNRLKFRKKLNLDNPQIFNKNLQRIKFNYKDHIFSIIVEKFAVRKYVEKKGFCNLLIPLYGILNYFNEINFRDSLKCNHDSGNVVICTNQPKFNENYAKRTTNRSFKKFFFSVGREWQYKNIHTLIICEKCIGNMNFPPMNYNIIRFNGVPDNIMVSFGRETGNPKYMFYDTDWDLLPYNKFTKEDQKDEVFPKPEKLDYIIETAKKLSRPFYFSRFDYNLSLSEEKPFSKLISFKKKQTINTLNCVMVR